MEELLRHLDLVQISKIVLHFTNIWNATTKCNEGKDKNDAVLFKKLQ